MSPAPPAPSVGETTVREQGEVQQHQLSPQEEGGPSPGRGRGPSLTSKVPGELGLSFFPRVDACRADACQHLTSQLLLCSAAWWGVGHTPTGLCFWNLFLLWAYMSPCQLEGAGLALLAPEDHFQSCQLPRGRPDSTWDRWQVGGACW